MRRWGYWKIATMIAVLHFIAAVGTFALGFSIGLKRWDTGSAGTVESVANTFAAVLFQPGAQLLAMGLPAELDWMIILGNSVLWGLVGAAVVAGLVKRRT